MTRRTRPCDLCPTPAAFPLSGESFTRRGFLRLGGLGLMASFFGDAFSPSLLAAASRAAPSLQGTARNCIVVFLEGAPSNVDMWDLKEGPWTPSSFAPTSYGGIRWPQGLLGKTAVHLPRMVLVRSAMAWVAVHPLAQRWMQIGRNPAGVLGSIAPHIGAVVSLESVASRRLTDVLPAFIALEPPKATNGYFSSLYGPLTLRVGGTATVSHPDGLDRLQRRLALLDQLDPDRATAALAKGADDFGALYPAALRMTQTPEVAALFKVAAADHTRYGSSRIGDALVLARQLIAADRGTRFVQATSVGWDDHNDLYTKLPPRAIQLDSALGALLGDLATAPGSVTGKTLLDETLVVIYAEFGRTVGPLNSAKGRDHYQRMSVAFAGGGVKGGRAIGVTDAQGDRALEYGWKGDRDIRPEDIAATIYSALGIDYTTVRHDDPLNRGFEYVPLSGDGVYEPLDELFTG